MDQLSLPRRVRHITTIRICNITPFPVRDAATSALSQPSEQSQFTSNGHLSDDTDVALARKRSRRISNTSVATLRSLRDVEEQEEKGDIESPGRVKSLPRHDTQSPPSRQRTFSDASKAGSVGPGAKQSTIRRKRTDSTASRRAGGSFSHNSWVSSVPRTVSNFSSMLPDHSQETLDHIIRSRLTETFVSVSILLEPNDNSMATRPALTPSASSPLSPRFPSHPNGMARLSRHRSTMSTPTASLATPPHSPLAHQVTTGLELTERRQSIGEASRDVSARPEFTLLYLSPVHRPSTNPYFELDADDIARSSASNATRVKIDVYGKLDPNSRTQNDDRKGKQKATEENVPSQQQEWRVLRSWYFDLSRLIPVPEELADTPTKLPSNTLVLTLEPFQTTFYLPPLSPADEQSRPPSPSAGYNSDPESATDNVRRARASSNASNELLLQSHGAALIPQPLQTAHSTTSTFSDVSGHWRNRISKTVGFPDLVKLVTLQTVVADTQSSLNEVVNSIERNILSDGTAAASRAVNEREATLDALRNNIDQVHRGSDELRERIARRRTDLEERRKTLELARNADSEDAAAQLETQQTLSRERDSLAELRSRIAPLRTDLITTLASIFPIDLVAPADLLFSIVDVPLPIPIAPSDPAPPLSLPSHRELNEDTVASALGFAAQVVAMLAAYLGHRLVYPMTCIGSRSLIKDEISAMVGPHMFPLYSKGVDTYRFEYGVFLLNKDIEMLMAERNLRALDIRHTLPNLKNLLLTLTDGGVIRSAPPRPPSVAPTVDSLATSTTPTPRSTSPALHVDDSVDQSEQSTSGEATPTRVEAPTPKKASKGYFGLSGFLRSRYPSVKPSIRSVPEAAEDGNSKGAAGAAGVASSTSGDGGLGEPSEDGVDDEDDRRTIRAAHSTEASDATGSEAEEEGKREMNGHANVVVVAADRSKEHKLVVTVSPSSPTPPIVS